MNIPFINSISFLKELNKVYYAKINKLLKGLRITYKEIPYFIVISKELPLIVN